MKKAHVILVIFLFGLCQAQVSKKVLFIGNSYTNVNNLPNLIDQLAISAGNDLIHDSNTPGGYTFQAHSTNNTTLNKIASNNWDFVVLQEQSQIPSFPPSQVATDCYPYAAILNDSIRANNSCTEPLFYMTWGRKNGDASNCGFYPPLCTYAGMQDRLRTSYMELATNNKASVAPVGVAWETVRSLYPGIELYSPDESHPSLAGSYLAACVFYSSIFRESSLGLSYTAGLDSTTVYRLQDIASSTVLDSLNLWRIGLNDLSLSLPADTSFCGDSLIVLAQNVLGELTWSTGETMNPITVEHSAVIYANVANDRGCELTDSIAVSLASLYFDSIYISACDSLVYNSQVFYQDTMFQLTASSSSFCDSVTVYNFDIDTSKLTDVYITQVLPVKKGDLTGVIMAFNAENADSMQILDSTFTLLYTSYQDYDTYFYPCNVDFILQDFYLLAYSRCKIDTVELKAYCIDNFGAINELNSAWKIYPNPISNYMEISNQDDLVFNIKIIDVLGRTLYQSYEPKRGFFKLDFGSFDKGDYFLILLNEDGLPFGKKMIQKL